MSWKRRIGILGLGLSGMALAVYLAAISWLNTPGARLRLTAEASKLLGVKFEVDRLRVGPLLGSDWTGVRLFDPRGEIALSLPSLELRWHFPWDGRSILDLKAQAPSIFYKSLHWGGLRLASLAGHLPGPGTLSRDAFRPSSSRLLAKAGGLPQEPSPWFRLRVEAGTAEVLISEIGSLYQLDQLSGTLDVYRGRRFRLPKLGFRLQGEMLGSLLAGGDPSGVWAELEVPEIAAASLGKLPPLSMAVLPLGIQLQGGLSGKARLERSTAGKVELAGHLATKAFGLRMGEDPLVESFQGRWDFSGDPRSLLEGPLSIEAARLGFQGLPLELKNAKGKLKVSEDKIRITRLESEGPFGPIHLAWDLGFRPVPSWNLGLETGGKPGSWLRGVTIQAGSQGMRLQDLQVYVPDQLDLTLHVDVVPFEIEPPSWTLAGGEVQGTARGEGLSLQELKGILYLDSENGYSFDLQGESGIFRGQLLEDRGLKLWTRSARSPRMLDFVLASP